VEKEKQGCWCCPWASSPWPVRQCQLCAEKRVTAMDTHARLGGGMGGAEGEDRVPILVDAGGSGGSGGGGVQVGSTGGEEEARGRSDAADGSEAD
jgi:hypothetical protein